MTRDRYTNQAKQQKYSELCLQMPCDISNYPHPGDSDGKESASMQDTWVQSLGGENPLQKGMATHTSILAWKIPCTEELGGL